MSGCRACFKCGLTKNSRCFQNNDEMNCFIEKALAHWNVGIGLMPGDVLNDQEGIETFKKLGLNMANLLKKVR